MNKKTKVLIGLVIACAGTLTLGACKEATVYDDILKQGYNAVVRFYADAGVLNKSTDLELIMSNVYKYDEIVDGKTLLFAPDDIPRKGEKSVSVEYDRHFLVGWFKNCEGIERDGQPVDEFGELCSVSGRPQGYTYSDRWDFPKALSKSDFTLQADGTYAMELHAGWVPYFTYRIVDKSGNEIASYQFDPSTPKGEGIMENGISVPVWNLETGALDYGDFPKADGKTFVAAYDSNDSSTAVESIKHDGWYKEEDASFGNPIKTYVGDYEDGEWFHISKAAQFNQNYKMTGCYEIVEDLDFGEKDENGYLLASWPSGCSSGEFSGKIVGNGKTIKNVTISTTATDATRGGLFGSISAGASIENINFENVTYSLTQGTRARDANFGMFAGEVLAGAKISGVTISGTFIIGNDVGDLFASSGENVPKGDNPNETEWVVRYHIGKIVGNLAVDGITDNGIELKTLGNIKVDVDDDGNVTATR